MRETELINTYNKSNSFAMQNGVEIVTAESGCCECRLNVTEKHLNALGTLHGGMIFTLADTAVSAAANSRNKKTVLAQANINYCKKVEKGETLKALASELFMGRKLANYKVEILNSKDEIIASLQSTSYRFD